MCRRGLNRRVYLCRRGLNRRVYVYTKYITSIANMNVNDKLQTILTELRSQFELLYGDRLTQMVLYGSQARGDAQPDSDIDVLVVLKGQVNPGEEIKRTSHIRADLSLQNDEVLSCLFMDENRFTHYNGPLLRNIRKEGIAL